MPVSPLDQASIRTIDEIICRHKSLPNHQPLKNLQGAVAPPTDWLVALYTARKSKRWISGGYNQIYRFEHLTRAYPRLALRVGMDRLKTVGDLRHMLQEVRMAIRMANECPAPAVFGYALIDGHAVTAQELFDCDICTAFAASLCTPGALADGVTQAIRCMGRKNLVHADIKGKNMVMRERPLCVAIIDFDPKYVVPIPHSTGQDTLARQNSHILWMLLQIELIELAGHISDQNAPADYVPRLFSFDESSHTLRTKGSGDLPGLCIDREGGPSTKGPVLALDVFWGHIQVVKVVMDNTQHYIRRKEEPSFAVGDMEGYQQWLQWLRVACLHPRTKVDDSIVCSQLYRKTIESNGR